MKKITLLLLICMVFALTFTSVNANEGANTLGKVKVSAKSSILIEAKTGKILYSGNSNVKIPIASTTKIMSTILTLESGNLDDEFVVDSDAIKIDGSTMGLTFGDVVTKRVLCYGMMLPSGNDGANAAAVKVAGSIPKFVQLMNEKAEELGLSHTYYTSPSGITDDGGSSAYDLAMLARYALQNEEFREICSTQRAKVSYGNPPYERYLENTNKLLTDYPGAIGIKTGFTDLAGRCLVSAAEKNGVALICVTLNDKNDWADHMNLYNAAFSMLKSVSIPKPENLAVNVVGGERDSVPVTYDGELTIGVANELIAGEIEYKLIVQPFVYADSVKVGDRAGWIEFYLGDTLAERFELRYA
jgi:D-alanyl-D-alanine carboxypeptidase/D-alanyl-D-alanine carboxypeptidase (penicillin-binding protein 5/6)